MRETRQLPIDQRHALGARIVERRRAQRWSQRELARRTGLRYMRLSKLENGHATPSLPELLWIAGALSASLEELVLGTSSSGFRVDRNLGFALKALEDFATPEECAILAKLLRALAVGLEATRLDG